MGDFPFDEEDLGGSVFRRIFSESVDPGDLIWHRDREDRVITVVQSEGWQFQREDELPFELQPGDILRVPRRSYHRVIKGMGPLIVDVLKEQ